MPEKILAQTIAGASEHFIELINEDCEVTETHLVLKGPLDILVEDPTVAVNTFICHNPMDALINALWVLTQCANPGRIEKMLGRPVREVRPEVLLFTADGLWFNAGHFRIRYAESDGRLDAHLRYESGDAYEFLVEDFASISLCLQFLAATHGFGVGKVRISVERPSVHKEHVDCFYWDSDGWSIGLHNFYLTDIDPNRLLSETFLALEDAPPFGLRTKFVRRVCLPAISAMQNLQEQRTEEAEYYVRSMPGMLDWSVASQRWFTEIHGRELANGPRA